MGINFHITSVREGTIFNVMQFLSLEKVTGILTVSFGKVLPETTIYFVTGNVTTAEFGAIVGDAVLDVLLCQEYAIKEVAFAPGRINQLNEQAIIVRASSLSGVMLNVSKDVDKCESRPFIYGMLPLQTTEGRRSDTLLKVMTIFPSGMNPHFHFSLRHGQGCTIASMCLAAACAFAPGDGVSNASGVTAILASLARDCSAAQREGKQ